MYFSILKIDARLGQEHTIIEVLKSMTEPTAAVAGCLGCWLSIEVGSGSKICYQEQWRDRETLDRHLRSALYTRVLAAMELSCTQPLIEFYKGSKIGGLELVEMARNLQQEKS